MEVAVVVNYLTLMQNESDGVCAMDLCEGFVEFDCKRCAQRFLDDMVQHNILRRAISGNYMLIDKYEVRP